MLQGPTKLTFLSGRLAQGCTTSALGRLSSSLSLQRPRRTSLPAARCCSPRDPRNRRQRPLATSSATQASGAKAGTVSPPLISPLLRIVSSDRRPMRARAQPVAVTAAGRQLSFTAILTPFLSLSRSNVGQTSSASLSSCVIRPALRSQRAVAVVKPDRVLATMPAQARLRAQATRQGRLASRLG